ncbi:class I SAM-dependent methyltransferase [Fructobacillus evanidus]|uniref:Adenine-specific DNA N6-methylase (YtxK) n=1 Tax=Fructobacillus evanidus TaxID=3064281 RepID=A0ABN9YLW3_9LACO|nr:Adenine-specific DNA N6-methylase (YtxK) [Fructobacillus sp. LMG 32999]CAK1231704.1 Adenine-specific DNA N6-methylase (YtxK) [Fructobacillus sp. LMG 32999]CAK1232888.1 Adenine-specific DNA N6-methylase (YtxK) [Fructobacillus sp. LMG 32999]CAK1235707.1 Adenine-specific DNA N6-methylase (YtxK) [Fructobacillus sp. LMG 32999]CAK1238789.1 Adenine-specific DNA N6-methylase (YtxK) [Fructobacillus sp. LMG 32999]
MINRQIPAYFEKIDQAVVTVKNQEKMTNRAALVMALERLNKKEILSSDHDQLADDSKKALQSLEEIDWSSLLLSDQRNILQLLVLKADREDKVPANLQLTPDGIGYLLGELIYQTANPSEQMSITDMAVGTGNLLWTIVESFSRHDLQGHRLTGIDNDEGQLSLASELAVALKQDPTLLFGDVIGLSEEGESPADIVVGDLPIGYYPSKAPENFVTAFPEQDGQSYAHYLMIEKSLDLVKDDGWIYLIVPSDLLTGPRYESILKLFSQKAQLKAFLSLPAEYFQNQEQAKAFLVLRKKDALPKQEVLMGQYPSVKDQKALQEFLQDIQAWGKLK